MASVNKVILVGRAGKDPVTRVSGQNTVTEVSIATSEKYKDKQSGETKEITTWHELVFWNKLGEIVGQYVKKGSMIYVEGSIKTDKYQKDGHDVYRTKIVVNSMQLLGDNKGGSGSSQSTPAAAPASTPAPSYGGGTYGPDDDIPF
jgi:single-strand DNA-binding protein